MNGESNNKQMTFVGVIISEGFMTGYIPSADLIDNFHKSWIPGYQRDRVDQTKKITDLKNIFIHKKKLDSVKINLAGKVYKKGEKFLLDGTYTIPDGQQRILALIDSGVRDYNVPVELYVNSEEKEQIDLFHQFNRKPTKLAFGDLAKSVQGSYGNLIQSILKKRNYPIPVVVSGKYGISLSLFCPLLVMVHRKLNDNFQLRDFPRGKIVLEFFEKTHKDSDIQMAEYGIRKILEAFVNIFGEFDPKAFAYRRVFFLAWFKVVIEHFLQEDGTVDFGKFKARFHLMPDKLINNASVRESIGTGTKDGIFEANKMVISYLNRGMIKNRLPTPIRRLEDSADDFKEAVLEGGAPYEEVFMEAVEMVAAPKS